ncbi:hypothetical protein TNCV_4516221 [Trichonephila clavipes]|nr:hypothetical protein TNCV_4516221 [Trichonephila clavipes]
MQKTLQHLMDPCYFRCRCLVFIRFIVDRIGSFLHGSHNLVMIQNSKSTVFCIACRPGFYVFFIAFSKSWDRLDKVVKLPSLIVIEVFFAF